MPRDHAAEIELLTELGQACFGEHWKQPFCREFDVDPRALSRWLSGENIIPLRNWEHITHAAIVRSGAIMVLAREADGMWRAALAEIRDHAKP